MFKEKEFFENSKKFFLLLFSVSFFFLFLNFFGIQKTIFESISFLAKPVDSAAFESSKSVKNFFGVFGEVRTLRSEYYELKEEYLKLKAESNLMLLLKEENLALREQLGVDLEESDLVLAEVLFQDWALRSESLVINRGERHGLSQGDIVLLGDMYIGLLSEVYEDTSKVRLPTSRASSLKVMIVEKDQDFEDESFEVTSFLSGIAVGKSNVLSVENIEMRGNLREGDIVLLNDTKVGTHLYLGNVLTVDEDPTATLRSCTVKLPVDYENLKRVFVRKGNN